MDNNQTSSTEHNTDSNPSRSKRKTSFLILFLILLVIGGGWFAYYQLYGKFSQETDDAYVDGDLVTLSPEISGTVSKVVVDEGDYVEKGQVLVSLDNSDAKVALQEAEAKLGVAVRQVRSLFAMSDYTKAKLDTSKVGYNQAINDYKRRQIIVKSGAISEEDLTHYSDQVDTTKSQYIAAQQEFKMSTSLVDNTVIETHPAIKAAVAGVRKSYLSYMRTQIVAPISGYVAKRSVQLGSRVQPSSQLMVIVPLHQVWVDANFKESQMKDMRIGQPVTLTSDLYGEEVEYKGEIESLGIGTGSAFSLLPAQNASGNWIKIVQRLPVKIRLQPDNQEQYPLRIGLSMVAKVDIQDTSGKVLEQTPQTEAKYNTNVYQDILKDADKLVAKILLENLETSSTAAK
ncbi:EmrA/EmrK family multidrug efflux transporter periplasmic adaptor subunit [Psychromonas sp. B3M02]|uniref:efflux RND transporter periplasmic adaptor subunit n=1 Tax=Psychromonas sp. B3M02 TaxID=2267226 RepID=UPI000DEAC27A|nr:efflux RND transporter periplasmic adaptor subunit [Psychromonas sp. B3M02]RBW47111.1 EmrA/EmrK family multidrug efflux transporter periplasmic adaptor subunit [Psychromonas sp. B3M02]